MKVVSKNINKTILIFMLSILIFLLLYIIISEFNNYLPSKIKIDLNSNIPDFFNAVISIPITIAGTLLALILAKVAYEITEREFSRDSYILASDKYNEYYKEFANLSSSISKIIDMAGVAFSYYDSTVTIGSEPEEYENTKYENFYKNVKSDLHMVGFFNEINKLEDTLISIQSNSELCLFFERKIPGNNIQEIILSIRRWGDIPNVSHSSSDQEKGEILFKIISLFIERMTFDSSGFSVKGDDFYDSNIDYEKFCLIFFGCQVFSIKKVFLDIPEEYYKKEFNRSKSDEDGCPRLYAASIASQKSGNSNTRTYEIYKEGLKYELDEHGAKCLYLEFSGIDVLHRIINSIPNKVDIKNLIINNYGIDDYIFEKINISDPSLIISKEKKLINEIINEYNITEKMYIDIIRAEAQSKEIKVLRRYYENHGALG